VVVGAGRAMRAISRTNGFQGVHLACSGEYEAFFFFVLRKYELLNWTKNEKLVILVLPQVYNKLMSKKHLFKFVSRFHLGLQTCKAYIEVSKLGLLYHPSPKPRLTVVLPTHTTWTMTWNFFSLFPFFLPSSPFFGSKKGGKKIPCHRPRGVPRRQDHGQTWLWIGII
jgi:hypothetical protein